MTNIYSHNIGLNDSDAAQQAKETTETLRVEYEKQAENYKRHMDKVFAMNREEQQKLKETNPYSVLLSEMQKEQETLSTSLGDYKDGYEQRLSVDKWYVEEWAKVQANKNQLGAEDQQNAFTSLNSLYNQEMLDAELQIWEVRGEKIGDIVTDGFGDILTDFDNFDGNMKRMATKLSDYLIQESMRAIMQQIFGVKQMQSIMGVLDTTSKGGGLFGFGSSLLSGIFKGFGLGKRHSGGIIPVGANTQLPGTQEQLALLKGGERILSPGENTSYNNAQGGSSPVVFNNFNIKAWDSKDVSKYLLENRQLLNSITFEGIKNNNGHLRTMVRNA